MDWKIHYFRISLIGIDLRYFKLSFINLRRPLHQWCRQLARAAPWRAKVLSARVRDSSLRTTRTCLRAQALTISTGSSCAPLTSQKTATTRNAGRHHGAQAKQRTDSSTCSEKVSAVTSTGNDIRAHRARRAATHGRAHRVDASDAGAPRVGSAPGAMKPVCISS